MWNAFFELLGIITFAGWPVIGWVLWGRAARSLGVSRMALLGAVALFGWLLG